MCLRPTQSLRCGRYPLRQGFHAIAGRTSSISDSIMSSRHHTNDNFVEQLLKGGTDASGLEPGEAEAEEVDYGETDEEIRAAQGHGHADRGRNVGRWAACIVLAPQLHLEAKLDLARQQHLVSKLSPWYFYSLLRKMVSEGRPAQQKAEQLVAAICRDSWGMDVRAICWKCPARPLMLCGASCMLVLTEQASSFILQGGPPSGTSVRMRMQEPPVTKQLMCSGTDSTTQHPACCTKTGKPQAMPATKQASSPTQAEKTSGSAL